MKRILTFILLFVSLALVAKNDSPIVQQAEKIAEEYYSMFQQLAQLPDPLGEEGTKLEQRIMMLAGSDHNGNQLFQDFRVANDIDPVILDSLKSSRISIESKNSDVTLSHYVGYFRKYASLYAFNFSYKMLSCEPLDSPSMNMKGMEDDFKYAKVKVRKTFTKAGQIIDVDESMTLTFTEKGYYLSAVHNSCGNTHTSNYLFTQALEYYSKRQYKEALAMFEKQIELFKDPRAYYYAAIMYYKNQGCRGMGYSKRYQKFVEGMRVAANAGNYRAKFTLVREGIN